MLNARLTMSATWGNSEKIYSLGVLPPVTHSGRGSGRQLRQHILTTRPSISIGTRSRTCLQAQGLAPHRNPLRLVRHNFFSALCIAAAVMLFEGMGPEPGCCSG